MVRPVKHACAAAREAGRIHCNGPRSWPRHATLTTSVTTAPARDADRVHCNAPWPGLACVATARTQVVEEELQRVEEVGEEFAMELTRESKIDSFGFGLG